MEYYKPELSKFIEGFEFEVNLKDIGLMLMDFSTGASIMVVDFEPFWTKTVFTKYTLDLINAPFDFMRMYNDNRIRAIKN
jgi:hypothetical protein